MNIFSNKFNGFWNNECLTLYGSPGIYAPHYLAVYGVSTAVKFQRSVQNNNVLLYKIYRAYVIDYRGILL
jgi:hypothetical protein